MRQRRPCGERRPPRVCLVKGTVSDALAAWHTPQGLASGRGRRRTRRTHADRPPPPPPARRCAAPRATRAAAWVVPLFWPLFGAAVQRRASHSRTPRASPRLAHLAAERGVLAAVEERRHARRRRRQHQLRRGHGHHGHGSLRQMGVRAGARGQGARRVSRGEVAGVARGRRPGDVRDPSRRASPPAAVWGARAWRVVGGRHPVERESNLKRAPWRKFSHEVTVGRPAPRTRGLPASLRVGGGRAVLALTAVRLLVPKHPTRCALRGVGGARPQEEISRGRRKRHERRPSLSFFLRPGGGAGGGRAGRAYCTWATGGMFVAWGVGGSGSGSGGARALWSAWRGWSWRCHTSCSRARFTTYVLPSGTRDRAHQALAKLKHIK